MSLLSLLNSQPWMRPVLMILTGAAFLVQQLCPAHTVAHHVAGWVLGMGLTAGAGSLGQSNSGVSPDAKT